jgi:hypothetical protein
MVYAVDKRGNVHFGRTPAEVWAKVAQANLSY